MKHTSSVAAATPGYHFFKVIVHHPTRGRTARKVTPAKLLQCLDNSCRETRSCRIFMTKRSVSLSTCSRLGPVNDLSSPTVSHIRTVCSTSSRHYPYKLHIVHKMFTFHSTDGYFSIHRQEILENSDQHLSFNGWILFNSSTRDP
jgi:hypothetical protein